MRGALQHPAHPLLPSGGPSPSQPHLCLFAGGKIIYYTKSYLSLYIHIIISHQSLPFFFFVPFFLSVSFGIFSIFFPELMNVNLEVRRAMLIFNLTYLHIYYVYIIYIYIYLYLFSFSMYVSVLHSLRNVTVFIFASDSRNKASPRKVFGIQSNFLGFLANLLLLQCEEDTLSSSFSFSRMTIVLYFRHT